MSSDPKGPAKRIIRAQTWEYPSVIRCVNCHVLIGVEPHEPAPEECPACHTSVEAQSE